jgi:hypothetical protein
MQKIAKSSASDSRFEIRAETPSAIPVELASFDARTDDRDVVLTWKTESEENNAGFEVQRKTESGFEKIGFVDGKGTASRSTSYRYRAADLAYGKHMFRLRQVDRDGSASYSDEVKVKVKLDEEYDIGKPYPNPFRSRSTLDVTVRESQKVQVVLYDVLGRRVKVVHDGRLPAQETTSIRLRSSQLSSGVYFLRVKGDAFSEVRRVVHVE